MSNQSAKKKRISSRRRVVNQSKTSEADEFHITDTTPIAQCHIPEENTESLNVLANLDGAQSETQNPPSPELPGNRRKLGSSRRNKEGQHVRDSATESYHKPSEEVEGKTRDYETTKTKQMSLAMQPERPEELNKGSGHYVMSATHDSSLYSVTKSDSFDVYFCTATNSSKANLESFIPSENVHAEVENETDYDVASDNCKLEETKLGGNDTLQGAEQNARLVAINELNSLEVLSCSAVDQQLLHRPSVKEMPEEELFSVSSFTVKESEKRDEDTVFLRPDGNLQDNYVVNESHLESVIQFSTTPDIPNDESSPREGTEIRFHVERGEFSSSKGKLSVDAIVNFSDFEDAHLSEGLNKMYEHEVEQTEMQEIDCCSETLKDHATGNSEIISGKLLDQDGNTYQSELMVKSTDGSATKQKDFIQDEHHAKHNNSDATDYKHEDDHVYDPMKPQISNTDRTDIAPDQVHEIEGQVEDDVKPSAEQTADQEKEGILSEAEDRKSFLQTLESDTNVPLESGPQQTDTDFKPIGSRRKMGSSRRNKGRQQIQEPVTETYHEHKEVVESTMGNDASFYSALMPDYSSEVQNPMTTNNPEADLESFISQSESIQEHHDERVTDFKVVSDEPAVPTLIEIDNSDTLVCEDTRGAHHSEDAIKKEHEEEVESRDIKEIDYLSENVTHDTAEDSGIISGNPVDLDKSCIYQSELEVKSSDDSATKQEGLNPGDNQDEHHTKHNNSDVTDYKHEDDHVYDPMKPQISNTDRTDIAPDQVHEIEGQVEDDVKPSAEQTADQEKEGILSEAEERKSFLQTLESDTNVPLESGPQQTDTDFKPIGSRRKMGSSRRNKGRQQIQEPVTETYHEHKEVVESTMGNDASFYSALMPDYSSEVQNPMTTNNPEADLESFISQSESIQEHHDERVTDFKVVSDEPAVPTLIEIDNSDTLVCEDTRGAHHSEDAIKKEHEEEVESRDIKEIDYLSENVTHDTAEDSGIISGNPVDLDKSCIYQSELEVKSSDDSATKQEGLNPGDNQDEHHTKHNNSDVTDYKHEDDHVYDPMKPQISNTDRTDIAPDQVHEIEGQVEDDVKPSAEQTADQEKEGILSEAEERKSFLQTLESDTNVPLESGPQQTDTDFKPIGSRRKMGSSRRNKGRQQIQEPVTETYHEHKEVVESTMGNDASFYSALMPDYSSEVQNPMTTNNPEADLESFISQSESIQEHHDERVTDFKVVSDEPAVPTLIEIDNSDTLVCEDTRGAHHSEDAIKKEHEEEVESRDIKEIDYLSENVTHDTAEDSGIISGNPVDLDKSCIYQSELEVKSSDDSATKQEGLNPGDNQDEHHTKHNNSDVTDYKHEDDHVYDPMKPQISNTDRTDIAPDQVHEIEGQVEDDVKPSAEQTADQEKEGILSEAEERKSFLQTLESDTNVPLESGPQQTDTDFKPIGSKRKMGSSRRNKGRQQIQEPVTETYHEHKEVVESTMGNDASFYSALMPDYSSEVQNPMTTNNPEADLESFISKSESIQEHHDERVTDFKVVSDEPAVPTLIEIDNSDTLVCEDTRGAHHSEDAIKKEHEEEVESRDIKEIDYLSENVTHDTAEDSGIISGNPVDLDKSCIYQSELEVKSSDDSATKQEGLNPGDNQDEHHTKHNNSDVTDYKHEDDHVYDPMKPQISNTDRTDIAPDQVHEIEGQVEDDVKPSAEQTADQEKEGILSEAEDRKSFLQTLESDTNVPLESGPQQTDTDFKPIGSRRKMGSSRRNKGRQQIQEPVTETYHEHKEVVESTMGNDASFYSALMPDYSSEVQNPMTTNNPEADLESFISQSESIQEHHDERVTDFKVVSDEPAVPTLIEIDNSDTLVCEDTRGAHHSEDAIKKEHEEEVESRDIKEIDYLSENVTHDTAEDSGIISGNPVDLDKSCIYQSELEVKSSDDSATKQEGLNPGDNQDEHHTKHNNSDVTDYKHEDDHVYDPMKPQISNTDRTDIAPDQVHEIEGQVEDDVKPSAEQTADQEKEGILSEAEERKSFLQTLESDTNVPLESGPQQTDTDFKPIGSRRKMGSSRRNKGRQQIQEPVTETYHEHKEVVESTMGNDASFYSALMPDYSSEVQNPMTTNNPEADLESFISQSESIQEHHDERVTDFKVVSDEPAVPTLIEIDNSDTLVCEDTRGAHHSEDAIKKEHEEEVESRDIKEIDYLSENVTHDTAEDSGIISGNPVDLDKSCIYQSELEVKSSDDSATKQEGLNPGDNQDEHHTKHNNSDVTDYKHEDDHVYDPMKPQISNTDRTDIAPDQVHEIEGQVEDDVKPSAEQTADQEKEGILSEAEERKSFLQTLESDTNVPLESGPQQTDTDFKPIGSRRKMGSSRRNKGRQQIQEPVTETYHEHKEVVESTMGNDASFYSALMPDYSSEVQNPMTTNNPEADLESFISQSESIQEHHDERVTDFKVVSDEPAVPTLIEIDNSDTLVCEDTRGAHHSEDAIKKEHEEEVESRDIKEIDYLSENVTHDTAEDSGIISGNPVDLDKSCIYQSELEVKSSDDSATKQEGLNPGDNQDEHHTKHNNSDVTDYKHEDDHVYDPMKPQISNTDRTDIAPDQVHEIEGQVEDDVKPSAEQTADQEKEGILSEAEERKSFLQTLESDTNVPLESGPQQTDTDFKPIGSRRKMGSSRRNKGRQQIQEPVTETYHEHKEVVESTMGNDASFYSALMPDYSSEVQNPMTTNNPEADLESFISQSESIQEHHDERVTDFKVVSDEPAVPTLIEIDNSDTLVCEDTRGAHHSEDAIKKEHEEEVESRDIKEIDYLSENVTHDTAEDSGIISGNPVDLDKSCIYQSELEVKSSDDSATKQEGLNPGDNQDEHHTKHNNSDVTDYKHEDDHVYDPMKPQISNTDRTDIAPDQVHEIEGQVEDDVKPSAEQTADQEKEGILSEAEERKSFLQTLESDTNVPLESGPQQTDTDFKPIGSRRKMGSSRRNKGRQQIQEPVTETYHEHKEVVESTMGNDASFYSALMPDYSSEVQNPMTTNNPEADLESFISQSESIQEHHDERVTDFKVVSDEPAVPTLIEIDNSDTLVCEDTRGAHHSEDAIKKEHEEEVESRDIKEIDYLSENVTHDTAEDSGIISGNPVDLDKVSCVYQSELEVKTTDDSATKQEDLNLGDNKDVHYTNHNSEASDYNTKKPQTSNTEGNDIAPDQVYEIECHVEDNVRANAEQTVDQEMEGIFSEVEKRESSLQTLQSETNALDSEPQQTGTGFNPLGSRRKLGSSRRNKGRQNAKDSVAESYHRSGVEVVGNTRDKTMKISSTIESTEQENFMETTLEGMDTSDTLQTEVSDQVEENTHVKTLVGISESLYSSAEKESNDRDEYTDLSRQNLNLQDSYLMCEHLTLEDIVSSIRPEISTKSPVVHTEIDCSIEQAAFSSSKEESPTNKQQKEHVNLPQVREAQHSEDAVSEVHKEEIRPTHIQDMDQTDLPSVTESGFSLPTLQSEMNTSFDLQHQDNSQSVKLQTHTGFNPTGSRRKMGSSRRNKGRQQVKDSFSETYEPKEGSEVFGTTKMSLATETLRQEELNEQTTLNLKPAERRRKLRSTVSEEENTEKILVENTDLSQNVMDNSTVVTTVISSSSAKDDFVKSNEDINGDEEKLTKQTENLNQLTGGCTVKMDLITSPEVSVLKDNSAIENIFYDDDSVNASPSEAQVSGQDEAVEEFGDPAEKNHKAQGKNDSHVIKHTEQFFAADNKMETLEHIGLEENFGAESAVDVPEKSGISSQHGIQEKTHLGDSENLQGDSKQKRRKMGSTRRTQLNRKAEGGVDNKDETEDKLSTIETAELSHNEDQKQETNETSAVHNKGKKLQSNTGEVVSVKFVQVADGDGERNVRVSLEPFHLDDFTSPEMHERSVLAGRNSSSVNLLQSSNTEDTSNTGITCETTQNTQNYGERPESVYAIQDQALKSAEVQVAVMADLEIVNYVDRGGGEEEHNDAQASTEGPNNVNDRACDQNLEMKSASPDLNLTGRRRKMGSTRRSLRSRTEGEHDQKQEVDNKEAETTTNVGKVKTESFSDIQERELQLKDKDSESEQRKEKVLETVEYSHIGESHFKPPPHQTFEENPVPHGQVESDYQPTPSYLPVIPSTSPKHDGMSESESSRRRRKMGSHRKSRGHQNKENQSETGNRITDSQNGRDIQSISDESAIKTTGEESFSLDRISEVAESDKKATSNISTSKAGEHLSHESEKIPEQVTPVQPHYAEIRPGQESRRETISLADNSREVDLRSSRYNVVMVGDSSVGKTSFMKRAQSGKFSLDLPASVGLDSCVWTVTVDGKPVVLQLWDTAGQERFHSITRQILHKAQAFLLMYDITSSQSFSAVSYWANCIQEGAAENVTVVLLGNKSDHAERRVKTQDGEILAKEYNFEFMECSAATGENVVQCLETVARTLSQRVDPREEPLVLKKAPKQTKSSGCC